MIWTTSVLSALSLTGALAWPLLAQPADLRTGSIPTAIGSLDTASFHDYPIVVSEFAPLAVFAGSGKELAIDGRPTNIPVVQIGDSGQLNENDGLTTFPSQQQSAQEPAQRALLAGRVGSVGKLPGGLQLMHPVTTRRISSPYGWRANPTGAGNQIHIGQDYPIACGSPVYASESGRVVVANWAGHSGLRVTLDHGYNVHTGYSHNSKMLVRAGQNVQRGEVIALSGTTGNSTGCHVHFEVLLDGRWNDPRLYLPANPGQPEAMIDSTSLTVDARNAPKAESKNKIEKEKNPDVVVPEDDTPVIPKPEPTVSAKPSAPPSPPTVAPTPSKPEEVKPTPSSPTPSLSTSPSQSQSRPAEPSASHSVSPTSTTSPSQTPSVDTPSSKPTVPEASQTPRATPSPSLQLIEEVPSSSPVAPTKQTPTTRATSRPEESKNSPSSASAQASESGKQ
ncbi:M23 family metallopeptidase [Glutamicibacter ardleyensis]|uniref:M23 family metallopeptidase n=1 Tax=Glutamicibacter ardleyensis TaxID=225894 RepID=UPI001663C953|nr:M23 family metallopeptidase [Glutamicibacter ardleyensis]